MLEKFGGVHPPAPFRKFAPEQIIACLNWSFVLRMILIYSFLNFHVFFQTGGSKGYAFVEFACDEVAKIVAETMNNYMMFGRLLKCTTVFLYLNALNLVKSWFGLCYYT